MKRWKLGALICAGLFLWNGCALLPEEEELPRAPVISPYEGDPYTTCTVERGDVLETERVDCSYLAVKEETLRFALGGEQIEEVFVQVGSIVKAGDVLAELSMGTIAEDIEACEDSIELLELQLSHGETDRALAAKQQQNYRNTLSPEERKQTQTVGEVTAPYDSENERLSDELTVAYERLEELKEKQKERQLIATIDGAVTMIAPYEPGDLSSKTTDFITVSDSSTSAFIGNSREQDLFEPGDEVVLTSKTAEYAATVVSPKEFGIEGGESANGYYYYYFKLDNPEYELEEGDSASVSVVTQEARDVLWLPDTAIHYKGETPIVYYENEDGIRDIKEIEIGLSADHRVEIVSGLSEGDHVILS